jgi:hypothetical protein
LFVAVGTNWIWLFPATNGTVTPIVAQVSQLAVVAKFTVTALEAEGLTRLKSMGRAVVVPLE